MNEPRCIDCVFWCQADATVPEYGLCGRVAMHQVQTDLEHPRDADSDRNKWLATVVDGSDCFAALLTKDSFGCVEFKERTGVGAENPSDLGER